MSVFRPHHDPARTIYDAFQEEALLRDGRSVAQWSDAEVQAVWRAARDYAQQHDLVIPTLEQVIRAEQSARGHVDYGAQWAYQVARAMRVVAVEGR